MDLTVSQSWATSSASTSYAIPTIGKHKSKSNRNIPNGLSPIGKTFENRIQSSKNIHKFMQPAHRWSKLRTHASTLKQDVAIVHADISNLDKKINSSKSNGFQKIFKTDKREKLQQLKDEHARGILTKGFANDNLKMLHSDMNIFRKNQMLPDHVTDRMIDAHIES